MRGQVVVPDGIYKVSSIHITSAITLLGIGKPKIISNNAGEPKIIGTDKTGYPIFRIGQSSGRNNGAGGGPLSKLTKVKLGIKTSKPQVLFPVVSVLSRLEGWFYLPPFCCLTLVRYQETYVAFLTLSMRYNLFFYVEQNLATSLTIGSGRRRSLWPIRW